MAANASQILMDFALEAQDNYNISDFITSESNIRPFDMVTRLRDMWPHNLLIIQGGKGSGKSHLARIWHSLSDADYLSAPFSRESILNNKAFIIESVDKYFADFELEEITKTEKNSHKNKEKVEIELFELYNAIVASGAKLLLTTTKPIFSLNISLPDLRSRMNSAFVVNIAAPDDALLAKIIEKQANDLQIIIGQDVIDYALPRIERSYAGAIDFVEKINHASLSNKRNLSVSFVKDCFSGNFLKN